MTSQKVFQNSFRFGNLFYRKYLSYKSSRICSHHLYYCQRNCFCCNHNIVKHKCSGFFAAKSFSKTAHLKVNNDNNIKNWSTYFTKLAALLNCSELEVKNALAEQYEASDHFNSENLSTKISLLLTKFSKEVITKNLWILVFPYDELKNRLEELDQWGLDATATCQLIPLLKVPSLDFYRMSAKFKVEKNSIVHKNRIIFIAEEMQCSVEEVVKKCLQFQFLLFRNFHQIEENIKLLKDFKITCKDFLPNFPLLKVTPQKLRKRLEKMDKLGIKSDLWLIHCSEKSFKKKVETKTVKIDVMKRWISPEHTISQMLKLSPEKISELLVANPKLLKMDIIKLKNMLEFLLSSGYSTKQIISHSYVFNSNVLRLRERRAELKSYGVESPTISVLCYNQKNYDEVIERLKSKNEGNVPLENLVGVESKRKGKT